MSVTGIWVNSYGSIMDLYQFDDGVVSGRYKSDTGASGVYPVIGYAAPEPPSGTGQGLALSIYWRSLAGGAPNPTWHYVSGFSGQLIALDGTPSLVLLHAMVDSDDSPGPGGLGTYLDKLTYTPSSGQALLNGAPDPTGEVGLMGDPIVGTWTTTQGPGLTVQIDGVGGGSGYVQGSLTPAGGQQMMCRGFTDVTAQGDGLTLQSVSLSAYDTSDGTLWSLAGTLDLQTGVMTLLQMQSHGTTSDNMYAQTTATQYVLTRTD